MLPDSSLNTTKTSWTLVLHPINFLNYVLIEIGKYEENNVQNSGFSGSIGKENLLANVGRFKVVVR